MYSSRWATPAVVVNFRCIIMRKISVLGVFGH